MINTSSAILSQLSESGAHIKWSGKADLHHQPATTGGSISLPKDLSKAEGKDYYKVYHKPAVLARGLSFQMTDSS